MRAVLAGAAATAALLTATVVPAAAAAAPVAAGPSAVALLVQFPNGSVKKYCVPYRAGMSGADVLAPANPTYGSGPYAGFVLKISGKGKVPPTVSTYWAYWQSPTGTKTGYSYASSGVTSTRPAAGSVEAWVWTTGDSTTFPHKPYAKLCPGA